MKLARAMAMACMKKRWRWAGAAALAAALVCGSSNAVATVVLFDDFSDGNDTVNPTWNHLNNAIGSTAQIWDASTGRYRIVAPGNSEIDTVFGYGFAGSYTGPDLTDVRVTADIVDFPYTGFFGTWWGVGARLNGDNSLPGENGMAIHGYGYQYEANARGGEGEMVLNLLYGGALKDIGSEPVTLDNTKDYRVSLEVVGNVLKGEVWELDGSGNPTVQVAGRTRDLDVEPVGDVDLDGNPATPEEPFVPYTNGYSGAYTVGHAFLNDGDFTLDNFTVESLAASTPGDFDNDGDVDGTDLGKWKTSFGADNMADADGDGDTDGADFLVWQQNYTGAPAGSAAAAAVPEPAAVMLSSFAFTVLGAFGRRNRARTC